MEKQLLDRIERPKGEGWSGAQGVAEALQATRHDDRTHALLFGYLAAELEGVQPEEQERTAQKALRLLEIELANYREVIA